MVRRTLLAIAALASCAGPAPQQAAVADTTTSAPAPASVMGAIVAMNVTWGDYHARGDAAGISALYTDDAVLMTSTGTDVVGQAPIREYFAHLFATRPDSILATNSATETLDVAGDRAYEAGTVTFTLQARQGGAGPRTEVVRYMTFWQKTPDGRWLIRRSLRPY